MKRLGKILLILAGVLVVLIIAALVGLNMYVQSPAAQARIQAQISEALGMPVELTSVSLGWSGAKLAGVRVPDGERNLLEASSFSAEYRLLPLLSKQLVIKRMVLDTPTVKWAQNADGKWVFPALPKDGRRKDATLPNAPGPEQPPAPESKRKGGFQVVLDKVEIREGTVELLDENQRPVVTATGVQMAYTLHNSGRVDGDFAAARLIWHNALTFEQVHSPILFEGGAISLPELRAQVAGGEMEAKLSVQTEAKDAPYTAELRLNGVDLARLGEQGGWEANRASGRANGHGEFRGILRKLDRTEGQGEITLQEAQLNQVFLFQNLNLLLQIPELSFLKVRKGNAKFRVANEKTYLESLYLETSDLGFAAKGAIRFDGKVTLDATLAVSESVAQQLPDFVRRHFSQPDTTGRRSIAFPITGKTDNMKTDLVDRILGKEMTEQVSGLLNNLFGKDGKKDKEKDKDKKEKDRDKEKKKKKDEPEADTATAGGFRPAAPTPAAPSMPVEQ